MKRLLIVFALMGIVFSACSPSSSVEITGVWELVSFGDPASPMPAAEGVDTSIEFKSDGTLAGNVGCNGFGGEYAVKGNTIEFGPIMSTMMFCEALNQQEATVLSVLEVEAIFVLNGNLLTLTSPKGDLMMQLTRKLGN